MKKTAKTTKKPNAKRTKKAASSGTIVGMVPLDKVLGCSFFDAQVEATGAGGFVSAELPFSPPPGVPIWLAVPSISQVAYIYHPDLGVLTVFHVGVEITYAQNGMPILRMSGHMQFDRQAPRGSLSQQIRVFGHIVFYSVPESSKPALNRLNTAKIKILANQARC